MSLFGLRLGMELLGNMMLDIAIDIKNGKMGDAYIRAQVPTTESTELTFIRPSIRGACHRNRCLHPSIVKTYTYDHWSRAWDKVIMIGSIPRWAAP